MNHTVKRNRWEGTGARSRVNNTFSVTPADQARFRAIPAFNPSIQHPLNYREAGREPTLFDHLKDTEETASSVAFSLFGTQSNLPSLSSSHEENTSKFASMFGGEAERHARHSNKVVEGLKAELAQQREMVAALQGSTLVQENNQLKASNQELDEQNQILRAVAKRLQDENREMKRMLQNVMGV